jgi:type I restriction enzyme M protein
MSDQNLSSFIWSVADLLRGDYKQSDYGKVILPFTVLRRLDCVLEAAKPAVLAEFEKRKKAGLDPEPFLLRKTGGALFYNTSPLDLKKLMGDQDHIGENLRKYLQAFSPAVRDIFEHFEFHTQIDRLAKAGLLYLVTEKFATIDLHPEVVSNAQMGAVFEELIRKFAELSNETAGEHFTPREVIRLMVNLLFIEDDAALTKPGVVRSLYDPTAGTGGMLSVAGEHLAGLNPDARLVMFGQELNPESYAICKADMLIKGQDIANIVFGNTLSDDGLPGKHFDYALSNPPFGVEWKKIEKEIRKEAEEQGYNGRFGPGLPRVSDGSLLFLLHLLAKMRPAKDGGSRFGIVLNGSPLFTGGAGSGESEIRRHVLENDLVEAIIGLPTDMFYNTGISTYVWIVSNRKPAARKGKVQLIDASGFWQKMRKSLGSKRKELSPEHIEDITQLFGDFKEVTRKGVPISRIFKNEDFGYRTITVERPLRYVCEVTAEKLERLGAPESRQIFSVTELSAREGEKLVETLGKRPDQLTEAELKNLARVFQEYSVSGLSAALKWGRMLDRSKFRKRVLELLTQKHIKWIPAKTLSVFCSVFETIDPAGDIVCNDKGEPVPNTALRDTENVPLNEAVQAYFKREVLPHAPDAWIDHDKTKVGYEIPFNRHFYIFTPPRALSVIDAELKTVTDKILTMIGGLTK